MTGLTSMLRRMVCWQKVDFPEPGGPTSKIRFLGGTSCIWVKETNNYPIYKVADASLFKLRLVSKQYLGIYLQAVALGYSCQCEVCVIVVQVVGGVACLDARDCVHLCLERQCFC